MKREREWGGVGGRESVINQILTSCQTHGVTSGKGRGGGEEIDVVPTTPTVSSFRTDLLIKRQVLSDEGLAGTEFRGSAGRKRESVPKATSLHECHPQDGFAV